MNEILEALEKVPIKWKAIVYLLIDTGCRRGEIMGLKWDKINWETGVIVIDCNLLYSTNRGVYEDTIKTGNVRAIKIAPQTIGVLQQWRTEYERLRELNGDRWANTPYVTAAELGHANTTTTATIYAHQIAITRATAAEIRGGVFSARK